MLKSGEINAVSAVPSLWRVLLKNKEIFGDEIRQLKWIEIGSQYMSKREKEELKNLFSNAIIVQHYGLTEASRTSFLRIDQEEGEALESVGKVVGKTEIKICVSGRICIKGPHVAEMLLKNGKYCKNVDAQGWFETQDLGRIEQGYLYYCGRSDDLINCGGIKLSPDALENEIKDRLAIKDGLAVGAVDDDMTGQGVLVVYLDSMQLSDDLLHEVIHSVLVEYGINNKKVIKLLKLDEFPLTDTNKVKRKELSTLYRLSKCGIPENKQIDVTNVQSDLTEEERKILKIWMDILETEDINIDSNFYELGGDSISAISALIEMERNGVPSEISKGMLQGLSIREIAVQFEPDNTIVATGHQIRSPAIHYSMVINNVRGLMVLMVIFAHWHQGIIQRLPLENPKILTQLFAPLLAMGTPGFAIIYGVGAGFSLFPIYKTDRHRLKAILKKTSILLASGITLLAAIVFLNQLCQQSSVSFTDFTNSFYSVLTYYFLVSVTLYFWFKLLEKQRSIVVFSLFLALVFYSTHVFFISRLGVYKAEGVVEFIKLLFTAKYSYFLMLSGTFVGIAIGLVIHDIQIKGDDLNSLFIPGLTISMLGVVLSIHVDAFESWMTWPVSNNYIWRWFFYSGVVILLLVYFDRMLQRYNSFGAFKKLSFQALSIIGMLAFPLFILHEMVMPLKAIMYFWGVSGILSLSVPLFAFLLVSGLMFKKLYHFTYA